MTEYTLTQDTLQAIALFERITKISVIDCLDTPEKILFLVKEGNATRAVGKDGEHVIRLHERFQKNIQIVEFSQDPIVFVKNVFHGYKVLGVDVETRGKVIHATVKVDPQEKAKAIGKAGRNLRLMRDLINRHHNIQSVSVA